MKKVYICFGWPKQSWDKGVLGTEVRVACNGEKIFPSGPSEKSKLIEDYKAPPFR